MSPFEPGRSSPESGALEGIVRPNLRLLRHSPPAPCFFLPSSPIPHAITRKGVRQLIEDLEGRVAAEAKTASEAAGRVETVEPDLLVSELNLRSGTGLEVLAQVRKQGLLTVPLMLSCHRNQAPASPTGGVTGGPYGLITTISPFDSQSAWLLRSNAPRGGTKRGSIARGAPLPLHGACSERVPPDPR